MIEMMAGASQSDGPQLVISTSGINSIMTINARGNGLKVARDISGNVLFDTIRQPSLQNWDTIEINVQEGYNSLLYFWFEPRKGRLTKDDTIIIETVNMLTVLDWKAYPYSSLVFHPEGKEGQQTLWLLPDYLPKALRTLEGLTTRANYFNQNVSGWDTSRLTSLRNAFNGCWSFNGDGVNFDTSNVTDMSNMFKECGALLFFIYGHPNLDTSKVTDFSGMYEAAWTGGGKLQFDMSNALYMDRMFKNSRGNVDVSALKFPKVKSLEGVFAGVTEFTGTWLSSWNVSNVTNFRDMFSGSELQTGVSNWDVSKATNMSRMFRGCYFFDGNVSNWNTSNVTDMSGMFQSAGGGGLNLSGWRVDKVTDMSSMFDNMQNAKPLSIGNWNTGNVTNMSRMFSFNYHNAGDLSNWNVSKVTDMSYMFSQGSADNPSIGFSNWNTSSVTNMEGMFQQSSVNIPNITNWNTSNVKNMSKMFENSYYFNQDLTVWNVSKVTQHENFANGVGSWPLNRHPHFPT